MSAAVKRREEWDNEQHWLIWLKLTAVSDIATKRAGDNIIPKNPLSFFFFLSHGTSLSVCCRFYAQAWVQQVACPLLETSCWDSRRVHCPLWKTHERIQNVTYLLVMTGRLSCACTNELKHMHFFPHKLFG